MSFLPYIRICPGESKLLALLRSKPDIISGQIQLLSDKALVVGDVIIGKMKDEKELPYLHLERKTNKDLWASVTEKVNPRYPTQNAKLHALKSPCGYLIEMDSDKKTNNLIEKVIWSLQFKHLMVIKISKSIQDSCDIITKIASRVIEYQDFQDSLANESDLEIQSQNKKGKAEILFIRQLMLVTSLSYANSIQNIYPTMKDLQKAWNQSSNPSKMLSGIPNVANKKKVGEVTSEKVYAAFFIGL